MTSANVTELSAVRALCRRHALRLLGALAVVTGCGSNGDSPSSDTATDSVPTHTDVPSDGGTSPGPHPGHDATAACGELTCTVIDYNDEAEHKTCSHFCEHVADAYNATCINYSGHICDCHWEWGTPDQCVLASSLPNNGCGGGTCLTSQPNPKSNTIGTTCRMFCSNSSDDAKKNCTGTYEGYYCDCGGISPAYCAQGTLKCSGSSCLVPWVNGEISCNSYCGNTGAGKDTPCLAPYADSKCVCDGLTIFTGSCVPD